MRILLTADPGLPVPPRGYGGIERIVDALVREYRATGHRVALLAEGGSSSPADERFEWPGGADEVWRNALALRDAARRFSADVVHSFSRLAYLSAVALSGLPKVMSYQRHTGGARVAVMARVARRSLRFTGCSEFICEMGRRAGGDWTAIPNFVDVDRIPFVAGVPPDAPLLFLSRIESIKGPDVAIDVARASGRRLVLAGNRSETGPEREFWDRAIQPRLGEGVEWVGEVDDVAKSRLLGHAAALIVPIRWDEPFGIVFVEALAAGTPILTRPRGAAPEIVEPGRTGLFFETVEEGVASVRRLGELDRAACRRVAEARFSRPRCAERYLSLFRAMTGV